MMSNSYLELAAEVGLEDDLVAQKQAVRQHAALNMFFAPNSHPIFLNATWEFI